MRAAAQGPSGPDLQSFRIIPDRNIFDPNRSARRDRSTRRERSRESGARVESFQLVGTMSYDKGQFAFFDGTSSEYRKAIQPSESIAGYKVVEIASDHVALETTNGPMQLRVGMAMRKQDDEGWQVAEAGAYTEASAATAPSTPAPAGSASDQKTETSSGAESDVLKRLLEKREQELKNESK